MKKMKHLNFRYRLFRFVNMPGTWAYKGANYECPHDPSKKEYTYNPAFLPIFSKGYLPHYFLKIKVYVS